MKSRRKSIALVAVQFAAIAYLAIPPAEPSALAIALLLGLAGAGIGAWAVATVRLSRLSVLPDPAPGSHMVTEGPYRIIRHPMYAAVLLVALAMVALNASPDRVAAWAVLAADLLLKIAHEERLLLGHFPGYAAYRRRTWRLMPLVY